MDPKNPPAPDVTAAPSAEPAAPAAPAPAEPTGGDPVTSTGESKEQTVPFSRFQDVNDKAKAEAERAAQLEEELAQLKEQQNQTPQNEDEVDPEVLDLVKKSASQLGFVSKDELDAREARIQVQQDITDLTAQYKESGIPFDGKKVMDYAKDNNLPITSKKALEAVYRDMNYEAIVEANRKAAVDSYLAGDKSSGEKGTSSGDKPPEEPKAGSLKDRIKAARENAGFKIN